MDTYTDVLPLLDLQKVQSKKLNKNAIFLIATWLREQENHFFKTLPSSKFFDMKKVKILELNSAEKKKL